MQVLVRRYEVGPRSRPCGCCGGPTRQRRADPACHSQRASGLQQLAPGWRGHVPPSAAAADGMRRPGTITRLAQDNCGQSAAWHRWGVSPSDVDPAAGLAGLRRVAFLLERQLAPTYRVKAFRAAAATLSVLP